MKKRLLASLMAATVAVTTLTGCGKTDSSKSSEIVTELTGPVSIEMWHYMTGKQSEVLQSIVDDFNANNGKGITVTALSQGGISDLNKKIIAASQSNTLPAIVNIYPDAATGLINDKKIVDLNSYVNDATVGMKDDIENDFIPDFTKELSQWGENKIYGLPMTKSTEVLYVNKNLLEQLGYTTDDLKDLTFEKLAEISQKAYDELGIAGFGFDSSSNAFISTLKEDGKDFVQMDGKINIQNDWAKKFMQFFREKTQSGAFRVAGEDKFLSGPFSNQKILSYQGSSAGFAHINNNDAFEIVVAEVPQFGQNLVFSLNFSPQFLQITFLLFEESLSPFDEFTKEAFSIFFFISFIICIPICIPIPACAILVIELLGFFSIASVIETL